jgi:hypothetical protein
VRRSIALIQGFLWQHGREGDAEVYHRKAKEYERVVAPAALERRRVLKSDTFIETGLSEATIAPIPTRVVEVPRGGSGLPRQEARHLPSGEVLLCDRRHPAI